MSHAQPDPRVSAIDLESSRPRKPASETPATPPGVPKSWTPPKSTADVTVAGVLIDIGRPRKAVLGVLAYGPSTGYEIRKLLSDTTSHFWKESYGQIYPTLEELRNEGLIEVLTHETTGRETRRFAILLCSRIPLELSATRNSCDLPTVYE
ncbi:MAG: hypothetical protein GVY29_08710 [Spirochaetes bacterium]|jgi:hypothetical protein|nr:hypothetical protein [Spirochaetota bacterium]